MTKAERTRDQQVHHVKGQLAAVALDIRQARADDDIAGMAIAEQRRDELLDWLNRLVPPQRDPVD